MWREGSFYSFLIFFRTYFQTCYFSMLSGNAFILLFAKDSKMIDCYLQYQSNIWADREGQLVLCLYSRAAGWGGAEIEWLRVWGSLRLNITLSWHVLHLCFARSGKYGSKRRTDDIIQDYEIIVELLSCFTFFSLAFGHYSITIRLRSVVWCCCHPLESTGRPIAPLSDVSGPRNSRSVSIAELRVAAPAFWMHWTVPRASPATGDDVAERCGVLVFGTGTAGDGVLDSWCGKWKTVLAGEKTQLMVLSQWTKDARNCNIQVTCHLDAAISRACRHYCRGCRRPSEAVALGVTLDRFLNFGTWTGDQPRLWLQSPPARASRLMRTDPAGGSDNISLNCGRPSDRLSFRPILCFCD